MGFIHKTSTFGDSTHTFKRIYADGITNGTRDVAVEDMGKVKSWTPSTAYEANTLCYANDKLYLCLADHTSDATAMLNDVMLNKWKFIGQGIGSNLVENVLYSGNASVSSSVTYTMSGSIANYDYLNIKIYGGGTETVFTAKVDQDLISGSKGVGLSYTTYDGPLDTTFSFSSKMTFSGTSLGWSVLDIKGWSAITLASVTGIKIQELTTDYLASLSMPSDKYISYSITSFAQTINIPENGYLLVNLTTTSSSLVSSQIAFTGSPFGGTIGIGNAGCSSYRPYSYCMPVNKNNNIGVYYNLGSGVTMDVKFYYSIGAAKALGLI